MLSSLKSRRRSLRNASVSYFRAPAKLRTVTDQAKQPRRRRRGEELEAALLEAAWQELVEVGFAKLTMESIATRAKTGVAVLYRRWPNKDDLVLAAIRHYGATHPVEIPDTGNLRDDMVTFLSGFGRSRTGFAAIVSATFTGLMDSSGLTPAEVREKVMSDRTNWSDQILIRAQKRGEIDLETIPRAVLTMPFDLMRHELLMTHKAISMERVIEVVDDLFMPLVQLNLGNRRPTE